MKWRGLIALLATSIGAGVHADEPEGAGRDVDSEIPWPPATWRPAQSSEPRKVQPPLMATPAGVQKKRPFSVGHLLVDDDFGCALLERGEKERSWWCWRAARRSVGPSSGSGRAPTAAAPWEPFEVPDLNRQPFVAGFGRFCTGAGGDVRCVSAKDVLDGRGDPLAPVKAGPGTKGPLSSQTADKNAGHLLVGRDFTCSLRSGGLACAGDDRFGQSARGTAANATEGWPAGDAVVGAWHGCLHTPHSTALSCWGRNDAGQLGHRSTEVCRDGGQPVPCSRSPQRMGVSLLGDDELLSFVAGDLFTCVYDGRIRCWGGSRDGVFGTRGNCPAALKKAWPTRAGSVAAVRATCAKAPVEIAALSVVAPVWRGDSRGFSAGPRGLCALGDWKVRCLGAIPTPAFAPGIARAVRHVVVGSGDQPSACAVHEGAVYCWGAGYSADAARARPVRITFPEGVAAGAPVVDSPAPAGGWPEACLIHRACGDVPPPVAPCDGRSATPPSWVELEPRAPSLVGTAVSVRGALLVGPWHLDSCRPSSACCTVAGVRRIALDAWDRDGEDHPLILGNLSCVGDDSRLCCQVPAYGQMIRAIGTLKKAPAGYVLGRPTLCQEQTR